MAAQIVCDFCGVQIHLTPEEDKYRVDYYGPGVAEGFDLCKSCYDAARNTKDKLDAKGKG